MCASIRRSQGAITGIKMVTVGGLRSNLGDVIGGFFFLLASERSLNSFLVFFFRFVTTL